VPYTLDPELATVLTALEAQADPAAAADRGDWKALRATGNAARAWMNTLVPAFPDGYPDLETADVTVSSRDGAPIPARWYTKRGSQPGSAVVFVHGGGMVLGSVELWDPVIAGYAQASGVSFLSVDYRLAPESTGTGPAEDMFAGLAWLADNAGDVQVDPRRVAVMGDSAGGGIAAGTAILARERDVPVARQILIYPMLDDRNTLPDPSIAPYLTWTWDNNWTGWNALLGDAAGGSDVPAAAAPARVDDVTGLAPAYIEVGELDIFRDEDVAYAQRFMRAGIPVELHVHAGANHGFDGLAPQSALARRAIADRLRVIGAL
jgi:acetyl esterase/lipase